MALPRSVKVFDDKVTIKQVTDSEINKMVSSSGGILGLAFVLEDKIFISKDCPNSHKKKVLLHEIFHCAMYKSGLSQNTSPELEEILCQLFASLYIQLKKQNI